MRIFAIALLVVLTPVVLIAEPIAPGARVRVTLMGEAQPVVGTLVDVNQTSLSLLSDDIGKEMTFSRASIDAIDQSVGRNHKVGTLGLIGAGVGLVVGILKGSDPRNSDTEYIKYVARYAAIGALTGGFIGYCVSTDRWERVPFDEIGAGVGSNNGVACVEVRIRY